MLGTFRGIDWKLIALGVLGCFVLPWLALGTAIGGFALLPVEVSAWIPLSVLFLDVVGPPCLAAYIAVRFAANRPRLHALLLAVAGITAYFLFGGQFTFAGAAAVTAIYAACTALGATFGLKRSRRPTQRI